MSLFLLIVAFFFTGVVAIMNKALVAEGLGHYGDLYVMTMYGAPMVLGIAIAVIRREKAAPDDRRVGFVMGVIGVASMLVFLVALEGMPGIVAFPVRNVGGLVLTCIISVVAWHERLSKAQWLGIALSIAAIWLIC